MAQSSKCNLGLINLTKFQGPIKDDADNDSVHDDVADI
jgi:hypothetical protein